MSTRTSETRKCPSCGKDAPLFMNSRKAPYLKCERENGGCGSTAFLPRSAAPKASAVSTPPPIAPDRAAAGKVAPPAAPARKAKKKRAAKTPAAPAPAAPKEEPRASKRDYPWEL